MDGNWIEPCRRNAIDRNKWRVCLAEYKGTNQFLWFSSGDFKEENVQNVIAIELFSILEKQKKKKEKIANRNASKY